MRLAGVLAGKQPTAEFHEQQDCSRKGGSTKHAVAIFHRLVRVVEKRIEVEMKAAKTKGIMIDTWGKKHANTSYTAVEAVYDCGVDENGNLKTPPLLAFAPLLNEESSNAGAYIAFIKFVLAC